MKASRNFLIPESYPHILIYCFNDLCLIHFFKIGKKTDNQFFCKITNYTFLTNNR